MAKDLEMSKTESVICFAGDNYWFSNPHSRYHLMNAMHSKGHSILWVNSIGMNMPKLKRNGFWRRVIMKLKSWAKWLWRADSQFHVLTPIALPLFGNSVLEKMNNLWIAFQVRVACFIIGFRKPLLFTSIPSFAGVVNKIPHSGLIYYYSDKYDSYRDITARKTITLYDKMLFDGADAVFCAAKRVYDELKTERDNVYYLPHAVDFNHFNSALSETKPVPEDLIRIPKPRVGYFGSITDSNDQEMIYHAAVNAPEIHFIMIGRVLGDYSKLQQLPNVHFLGFKDYMELPQYGKHFDVSFMCWKMTDWIKHSNPLKTKEYLSIGLPVVSVRIDELEREYADLVYLVDDGPEFLDAVRKAILLDSKDKREARIDSVRGETWHERVELMMNLYKKAISNV
jgi:hypothetical protein